MPSDIFALQRRWAIYNFPALPPVIPSMNSLLDVIGYKKYVMDFLLISKWEIKKAIILPLITRKRIRTDWNL